MNNAKQAEASSSHGKCPSANFDEKGSISRSTSICTDNPNVAKTINRNRSLPPAKPASKVDLSATAKVEGSSKNLKGVHKTSRSVECMTGKKCEGQKIPQFLPSSSSQGQSASPTTTARKLKCPSEKSVSCVPELSAVNSGPSRWGGAICASRNSPLSRSSSVSSNDDLQEIFLSSLDLAFHGVNTGSNVVRDVSAGLPFSSSVNGCDSQCNSTCSHQNKGKDKVEDNDDDDSFAFAEGDEDFDRDVAKWRNVFNASLEEIRRRQSMGAAAPLYPHQPLLYMECQVCLLESYLRRRVCCDFCICRQCMSTYVTLKVNEAKVQIKCPSDRCSVLVHRDEIREQLTAEMQNKFFKFLVDANADPCKKTCPSCSATHSIEPKQLQAGKRKLRNGLEVCCPQCKLVWCFLCQAPYHTGVTCKEYRKGDAMVRKWAKEWSNGQFNARRCPKCKVYIHRATGCDRMICTHCKTQFCYICGDRYRKMKLLGDHRKRFSIFGCNDLLLPNRPGLRRLIRGASLAARLGACVLLVGLIPTIPVVLAGASLVITCSRIHFEWTQKRYCERMREELRKDAEQRLLMLQERRNNRRVIELLNEMVAREAALRTRRQWERQRDEAQAAPSTAERSEMGDNLDSQQVLVIEHRSVSLNQYGVSTSSKLGCQGVPSASDPSPAEEREERGFFINKYTAERSEMVVVTASSGGGTSGEGGRERGGSDSVITVAEGGERGGVWV